jgi:signal peptidase I
MLGLFLAVTLRWLIVPVAVVGDSMFPTYKNGQFLLASPVPYWFGDPDRGDIVVVGSRHGRFTYLKRILGLPGETIAMRQGRLLVDGRQVPEPYLPYPARWQWAETQLGADEYLVAGDNREVGPVLQYWGKVDAKAILARVLLPRPRGR